jgi:uncharacterized protein (DUF362 family)
MTTSRRQFVAASAAVVGGTSTWTIARHPRIIDLRRPESRVAILTAVDYSGDLESLLLPALKEFLLDVRGKSVLLKPNLVEHVPGKPVNTHPKLVGAAASCFLRLGAKNVVVAEGPGHERDTELVLNETGFEHELRNRAISFVDLNRDELVKVKTKTGYSGIDATCARLMGLNPRAVRHIEEGSRFLGNIESNRIVMIGDPVPKSVEPFRVLPDFRNLLATR